MKLIGIGGSGVARVYHRCTRQPFAAGSPSEDKMMSLVTASFIRTAENFGGL